MRRYLVGLMTACIALALIAGCSNTPDDQAITTEIKARFFSHLQLKSADIDVATEDGIATLTGTFPDDAIRHEAIQVAAETPGVKSVNDRMSIAQAEQAEDVPEVTPPPPPARTPRSSSENRQNAKAYPEPAPEPEPEPEPSVPAPAESALSVSAPPHRPATLPPSTPSPNTWHLRPRHNPC